MKKTYVQFMYEGKHTYFFEQEVSHQDPKKIEIPPTDCIVGFRFINRHIMLINGQEVRSQSTSLTGWYFIGTKLSENVVLTKTGKEITLRAIDTVLSDLS